MSCSAQMRAISMTDEGLAASRQRVFVEGAAEVCTQLVGHSAGECEATWPGRCQPLSRRALRSIAHQQEAAIAPERQQHRRRAHKVQHAMPGAERAQKDNCRGERVSR